MRLLKFQFHSYRNLRDLPIFFTLNLKDLPDETCSIRFLVGINGAGKSNLLRFLAAIFSALDEVYMNPRSDNPAYSSPFQLAYQLRGNTVKITSNGQGRAGITFTINDKTYEPGDFPGLELVLPHALMIYTSGNVEAWKALLRPSHSLLEKELLQEPFPNKLMLDEEQPPDRFEHEAEETDNNIALNDNQAKDQQENDVILRTGQERVFLVEPKHLTLALLAAFIRHYANIEQGNMIGADFNKVLEQVGISRLIAFSLRLTYDPNRFLTPNQRSILSRLYTEATLSIVQWDNEQLWVFDLDEIQNDLPMAIRLANGRAGDPNQEDRKIQPFQFFRSLVDLQNAGILSQVNMIIAKHHQLDDEPSNRILLVENLSDGEQAFLERMALIYLLSDNECLFLLDEPESHFNDTWKRDLVNQIELTLRATNSEVILTTHASITLSDAYPEEVILLTQGGQENVPLTLAAEPGELLRSVFGADRSVGRRAMRRINEVIEGEKVEDKEEKLRDLLDEVGPGYFRYKIIEELRRVSSD